MGRVVPFLTREQRKFLAEVKKQIRHMRRASSETRSRYVRSVIQNYGAMQERDRAEMVRHALEDVLDGWVDRAPDQLLLDRIEEIEIDQEG